MKKEKFIKKFGEYINQALYEKTSVRFDFYYNIDNGINISFHKIDNPHISTSLMDLSSLYRYYQKTDIKAKTLFKEREDFFIRTIAAQTNTFLKDEEVQSKYKNTKIIQIEESPETFAFNPFDYIDDIMEGLLESEDIEF